MTYPTYSERIQWCVDDGMTHREIAEQVGMDQSTVRMMHRGEFSGLLAPGPVGALIALSDDCRPASAWDVIEMDGPLVGPLLASRTSRPERSASARNLENAIRERLSRVGQKTIAEAADIDRTKMSRLLNPTERAGITIDEMHDFFDAIGMAVIECDGDLVSIPRDLYESLRVLAKRGLDE